MFVISRHNPGLSYGDFIFVTAGKALTQVCSEEEEDLLYQFLQGSLSMLGGFVSLKLGVKPTITLGCFLLM